MRFLILTAKPTPAHAVAVGCSTGAAGELELRHGCRTTGGQGSGGTGPDDLCDRRGSPEHLPGDQRVAGLQCIAEPQLDRVDPEHRRQLVHLGFMCETDLYRAKAPHRPARGVVGPNRNRLDDSVLDSVRAGRHAGGVHGHGRRRRQVGTAVEDDARLDLHQPAVRIGVVAVPHDRRMPVDMAQERLFARVDHLHRAFRAQRQQAYLHLHAQVLTGTEGTADAGQVEPDLFERERQACRHLLLVDVQPLGRDVEVDTAVLARDREPGLGAHLGLVLHGRLVATLDHDRSGGVRISATDSLTVEHVAERMDRLGIGRRHRIGHRFGRCVVDDDRRSRSTCRLRVVCCHRSDRLSHVPDDIPCEDGLVGIVEPESLAARHVVAGEHCSHTWDQQRLGHVDAADRRCRMWGAHDVSPQHAFGEHVGGEGELAADFGHPVGPGGALTEPAAPCA